MLYDYTGFAPEAYQLQWPAPSALFLVSRVKELLAGSKVPTAEDPHRGFDHGTFIPLMVALPQADLPVLQVSLLRSLAPAEHLAMGRALAPLRDEGVCSSVAGTAITTCAALVTRSPPSRAVRSTNGSQMP